MKTMIASALLSVAVLSTIGCSSSPRPNGWCALEVEGTCVMRWKDGVKVPAGEIDTKYEGASCSDGGEYSNDVYSKLKSKLSPSKQATYSQSYQHCGGNTSTKGKEWDI